MHKKFSLLVTKTSVSMISHFTILVGYFFCSCIFWYSRQFKHWFTAFSILAFMCAHYRDLYASYLIFWIPVWLLCSWLNISICNEKVLLFIWLLLPHHLSWPLHVWWANISVCLDHVTLFVRPTLYEVCLELLQVCIFGCCFLYIMCWCAHWQVH